MKTLLKYLASSALLILLFAAPSFAQQYTLTQTTLSADLPPNVTSFGLASVTNVTGVVTSNNTDLYIDRELMQVVSVNTTAKTVTVLRGVSGTQAAEHRSGQMVLSGAPAAFINYDPEGGCSTTAPKSPPENVPAQPTINTRTGNQWLCSSLTKTWVPGFGNPGVSGTPIANTALVADAAGVVLPSGPQFEMGGATNAVTGFTIPVGCNATAVGGCQFTVIPTTAWTWTTAGNIATVGTAVADLAITFRWDATTSKFIVQQSK
jgi:hypothetical protein